MTSTLNYLNPYLELSNQLKQLKNDVSPEKVNILMKLAKHFESHNFKMQAMATYQLCCKVCMRILFRAKNKLENNNLEKSLIVNSVIVLP